MGSHLIKTPLIALCFAALWHFAMTLAPVSAGYSEVLGGFVMPRMGYVYMIAYGLWLSIIAAMIFAAARDKGIKLFLLSSVSFIAVQWLAPMLPQFQFGETTGVMTRTDTLFKLACGCAAVILLLLLAALLFRSPHPAHPEGQHAASQPAPVKYKAKVLGLIIRLLSLPVIYCILYFLAWYFLLWRSQDVQVYYSGTPDASTFAAAMVNVLLTDVKQIPMSLLKGLLYALALLPMLFQLAAKRVMFIISSVMLFLGVALQMLIPSPLMPDAVRMAHLIEIAAESVVYGALAALMLHTSLRKPESVPGTAAKPVAKSPAPAK